MYFANISEKCPCYNRKSRHSASNMILFALAPCDRWPLIAACAFDDEADDGDFPPDVVEGTRKPFSSLQNRPGRFAFDATTKTRFVYRGLS